MDSTVLTTSLPAIAADIGENPLALKLALTSYLVSLAVFIPISGWVADRYGSRTVFMIAIMVFIGGSLLCAASSSLAAFVGSRFLQGIGGAMMVPVGRLVLMRAVPKHQYIAALNYLTVPAMLGPVIGPALGGAITLYFHWRWIFIINVPVGILGLVLVQRFIPNLREDVVPPFDWIGFILCGAGLSAVMLGVSALGGHLLSWPLIAACVAIGAAMLLAYARHARRTAHPSLDLKLFRIPTFFNSVIGGAMFRIGTGATPFLLPLLLQLGFGLNPLHSGLLTCSTAFGAMFMKTLNIAILKRWGFGRVLSVNAVLGSLSVAVCALFTASTPAHRDRARAADIRLLALAAALVLDGTFVRRCHAREHGPGDGHLEYGAAAHAEPRHRLWRLRTGVIEPGAGTWRYRRQRLSACAHRDCGDGGGFRMVSSTPAACRGHRRVRPHAALTAPEYVFRAR